MKGHRLVVVTVVDMAAAPHLHPVAVDAKYLSTMFVLIHPLPAST